MGCSHGPFLQQQHVSWWCSIPGWLCSCIPSGTCPGTSEFVCLLSVSFSNSSCCVQGNQQSQRSPPKEKRNRQVAVAKVADGPLPGTGGFIVSRRNNKGCVLLLFVSLSLEKKKHKTSKHTNQNKTKRTAGGVEEGTQEEFDFQAGLAQFDKVCYSASLTNGSATQFFYFSRMTWPNRLLTR